MCTGSAVEMTVPERAGLARGLCLGLLKSIDPWIGGEGAHIESRCAGRIRFFDISSVALTRKCEGRCESRKSMYVIEQPPAIDSSEDPFSSP